MVDEKKIIYNPSLTIRISPEMSDRLERVADMYGVTRGEIARIAIGQYVGQITGALDQIVKTTEAQAKSVDLEKMLEVMGKQMIEKWSGESNEKN